MNTIVPTLYDGLLSDIIIPHNTISQQQAEQLFIFFKQHKLFNWKNVNNGCEGKADAICLLLEEWNIYNYKVWIFGGAYLKKNHVGGLKQNWNYHVAPVITVKIDGKIIHYVLDPATSDSLQLIEEWAAAITQLPHSYYCIRQSHWYIFPNKDISKNKWNTRNKQNSKWMIQCLNGINGLTATGKAKLCFNKTSLKNTLSAFKQAKKNNPLLTL
jgi:hypothetical protein